MKCNQCDILISENKDLQITFDKFTKGINNLNILLRNKRETYNKTGLRYEP